MFKRQTLVRNTLATALVSAMFLSLPAHAGLLGGATGVTGGLGGGIAGGMGGGFGPGSMNAGGMAAGQGAFMPRVPDFTQQAGSVKQASTANASEQGSVSRERDGNLGSDVTGASMAGANLSRDAAQRSGRHGVMTQAMGAGGATSSRQADASANGSGSAQASRENASVNSDASAQGSVSH